MKAIGISNPYTSGKVYIIWEIPHDKITGYEIYRNNILIASSLKEEPDVFTHPTLFDHDHHTNLFKKDSTHKLMYVDESIDRYQHYEYKVIASRKDENGNTLETIESKPIYVQLQ